MTKVNELVDYGCAWDEYLSDNDELLLEDMMDRLDSLKEGIEPIEITSIEYGND